ncbi:MAG: putative LPS assembly protein LptD [Chitinophagales bacterium]
MANSMCLNASVGEFDHFLEQTNDASVDYALADTPDTSIVADSSKVDSAEINDLWYEMSSDALDEIITYGGVDSIVYDLDSGRTYIYANGEINYKTFYLKADFIQFDWDEKTICAKQITDSAGKKKALVYFKDGEDEFYAENMCYNFGTKKGKIFYFRTQEGEGYLRVEEAKKLDDDSYFGKGMTYTTCDLEHPHYYIAAKKAKVVPKKIAVTGPANLVIADVPTLLFLPFGIFPIKRGQTSGIIIPQYGNHYSQGYFLRNGGYYFALSDYYDLSLTGDIYSRGSYGLHASSRYNKLYRFNGSLAMDYARNKYGFSFAPNYTEQADFFVRWTHNQDAKARPNSKFGASVNVGTSDYLSNNAYSSSYLTNQLSSSISYYKAFPNTPFNFSAALRHNQNTSTKIVNLTLPEASLTMNRIYPLKKLTTNRNSFLYQFGVSYSMNGQNTISSPDSLLFTNAAFDKFENGIQHRVSASAPVKILKYFTLSPNFNYTENWYFESIRKNFDPYITVDTLTSSTGEDSVVSTTHYVRIDTINGFQTARYFNVGTSLNTKVYSTAQFGGKLKAIRHVMTPTMSFNYSPDYGASKYGYYGDYYATPDAITATPYSIFEGSIYGSPPQGEVGSIGLNIGNTLEIKVYSKKDSVTHEKKIKLIESFSFGTSYNLAADSLNLADVGFSGYTTLFKNVRINFSGSFDPYILDTNGVNLNQFVWDVNHRLGRFNGGYLSLSTDFQSKRNSNPQLMTAAGTPEEREMVWSNPDDYIDFEVPWSFSVSYNLRVSNIPTLLGNDSLSTTQSATFQGDINISPNWKIAMTTGYDFQLKDFTYTSLDIYRELHCWEMGFKWIPFGLRQSYIFNINVKASVLQDLKLTRKKDWTEY